jgi:hypothetical protein
MGKASRLRNERRHRSERLPQNDQLPPPGAEPGSLAAVADSLLTAAVHAALTGGWTESTAQAIDAFAVQPRIPGWRRITELAMAEHLQRVIRGAWQIGWQPVDLARLAGRRLAADHAALLMDAIAAELSGYPAVTLDPRWAGQLESIRAQVWWPADRSFLVARAQRFGPDLDGWSATVGQTVVVLATLAMLPRLQQLGPLPGQATAADRCGGRSGDPAGQHRPQVDDRILDRVRALLAKAESTTFPAEAETFTAGAQALMARHSIDQALLAATRPADTSEPAGRRIGIDNPYEGPKASLLSAVAQANRCRAVWTKDLGFCTVVGFESDLDAVELLFTSLLLQATRAMTQAGSRRTSAGSRTRSFRQSFLTAFASRIGERLAEATRQQTEDAAREQAEQTAAAAGQAAGPDLLPVLAGREQAVQDILGSWFPEVTQRWVKVTDAEGWHRGRQAADRATLRTVEQLTESPTG